MNINVSALQLDLSHTFSDHPARPARIGFRAALVAWIVEQAHAARAHYQAGQTERMLSQLPGHLRRDIGLPPRNTRVCVYRHF